MNLVPKAVPYALSKLGCKYSPEKRWGANPDIFDCSSLIYRAFRDAGYTFQSCSTSTTMVNFTDFTLLWPQSRSALGKQPTRVAILQKAGYKPQPGDVIYLNTNNATTRKNKITHVALVVNENVIVHARGSAYGVRQDAIDLYGAKVVAVARFREEPEAVAMVYPSECTGNGVNVRVGPSTSQKSIGKLDKGHPLVIASGGGEWSMVATILEGAPLTGYMSSQYGRM